MLQLGILPALPERLMGLRLDDLRDPPALSVARAAAPFFYALRRRRSKPVSDTNFQEGANAVRPLLV